MKRLQNNSQPSRILALSGKFALTTLCALVLFSTSLTGVAEAAKIVFTPSNISATAAPGEEINVPINVVLKETRRPDAFVDFTIIQTVGNLSSSWISELPSTISLSTLSSVSNKTFKINVPSSASKGLFSTKFRAIPTSKNEFVLPVDFAVNLTVEETPSCQPPTFTGIAATQTTVNIKNNKPYSVEFTGIVTPQEGCPLDDAWYTLTDEYGEMDLDGKLDADAKLEVNEEDGTFTATVTILASRDGKDKDGRLYTVVFTAENEAGKGESGTTSLVVAHDNGKK
ncbi:MAG: hypothetical protein C0624_00520 [Desulfuromonas sp.]|nr:MAG: hypothetical protein C0624_00520 [Desulfuromonas sp.]